MLNFQPRTLPTPRLYGFLVMTCLMNELVKCFWERGRGESKKIFKRQKGNQLIRDQYSLTAQFIWNLNEQSDQLKTGKLLPS